jgi:hypothetical protein
MKTKNFPQVKGSRPARKADKLTTDFLENMLLASNNSMGLHGLLQGKHYFS